jgi:hypothetical protein
MVVVHRFRGSGLVEEYDAATGRYAGSWVLAEIRRVEWRSFAVLARAGTAYGTVIEVEIPRAQRGAATRCRRGAESRPDWLRVRKLILSGSAD